jgi:phosphate/sulfate permease
VCVFGSQALSLAYPTLVLGTVIINLYFLLYKVAGRFSLAPEDALFKLLLRAGAGAAAAATVLATALLFPALKYAHAIKLLPQSPIGRHSARSMQEAQVTVRETQPSSKRDAQLSPRSSQSTQHSILLGPRTSQTSTRTSTSVRQSQFGRLLATNAHSHMEVQQEEGFSSTSAPKQQQREQLLQLPWPLRYVRQLVRYLRADLHREPREIAASSAYTLAVHETVELFDSRTEEMFSHLLLLTAAVSSLVHGAVDVNNAVGPLTAMYDIYRDGSVGATASGSTSAAYWMHAIGAAGLACGALFYSYNIMAALGVHIYKMTPSRA